MAYVPPADEADLASIIVLTKDSVVIITDKGDITTHVRRGVVAPRGASSCPHRSYERERTD